MKKILKSKKAGIPVINELVLFFLNTTPKPILLLLFLFSIGVISSFVVPGLLGTMGFSCVTESDSTINLYQVPLENIGSLALTDIKKNVRSVFGFEDYQLPDNPFPNGNTSLLRIPADCFSEDEVNGTTMTGYSSACVDCTSSALFVRYGGICLDDGEYAPDLVTKYWIGTANFCFRCAPPYPYFYSHEDCNRKDSCFFKITDSALASQIDPEDFYYDFYYDNIISLGGVKRTYTTDEFVNVQCDDSSVPHLYFFNQKIFDLELWIILFVAGAFISLSFKWYTMVL